MVQNALFPVELREDMAMDPGMDPMTDKGEVTITVIKPGFNAGRGRYYPPETLRRDFPIFEGAKMYLDHATAEEEKARPEGSIARWVGSLQQVWCEADGTVKARAALIDNDMKEKLRNLADHGMIERMGISIRALGETSEKTIEGFKTSVVDKLTKGRSVDFVTEPAAGGYVELLESSSGSGDQVVTNKKEDAAMEERIQQLTEELATTQQQLEATKTALAESQRLGRIATAQAAIGKLIGESKLPETAKARVVKRFAAAESVDGVAEAITEEVAYIASLQPEPAIQKGKVVGFGESKPVTETVDLTKSFMVLGLTESQAKIAASGR